MNCYQPHLFGLLNILKLTRSSATSFYKTMLFNLTIFKLWFLDDGIWKHKLSRTHFLSQKWQKNKVLKNSSWTNPGWCLQSGSSGDDLNEFSSNDSLPSSVVGQGQLVNHFTCKKVHNHGCIQDDHPNVQVLPAFLLELSIADILEDCSEHAPSLRQ